MARESGSREVITGGSGLIGRPTYDPGTGLSTGSPVSGPDSATEA